MKWWIGVVVNYHDEVYYFGDWGVDPSGDMVAEQFRLNGCDSGGGKISVIEVDLETPEIAEAVPSRLRTEGVVACHCFSCRRKADVQP